MPNIAPPPIQDAQGSQRWFDWFFKIDKFLDVIGDINWCTFDGTTGSSPAFEGVGVALVTRQSTGTFLIDWEKSYNTNNYAIWAFGDQTEIRIKTPAATYLTTDDVVIEVFSGGLFINPSFLAVIAIGKRDV